MNYILISLLIFVILYGVLNYISNAKTESFKQYFKFGLIFLSILIIIILIEGGRYLLTAPFFAILITSLRRKLFNIFNLLFIYKFLRNFFQKQKTNQNIKYTHNEIEEAYEVLGLAKNCSRKDIIMAHKKLIKELHPDKKGNTFLAAKVNRARDILLKIHK